MREVWGTIARETGALPKGNRVTQLGYILANEPHWYSEKGHRSAVEQDDRSRLVSILNIGKSPAKVQLGCKNSSAITVTDLFTGKAVGFELDL